MRFLEIILVLLLVLANGFFVAAEFALVKVRLGQIDQMVAQGHWAATVTQRVLNKIDAYLSACQLGITMARSEEHTSELQSPMYLVCRLLLEKKKQKIIKHK